MTVEDKGTQPGGQPEQTQGGAPEQGTQVPEQEAQTPEQNKEQTPEQDKQEPRVEYTGEALAQVGNFIESVGGNVDDMVAYMDKNGDVPLDFAKKLTEKHGEAVANLVIQQMKAMHATYSADREATAQENNKAIFSQLEEAFRGVTEQGGEETWKELAGWAKGNLDQGQRDTVNDMLAQGGLQAKLAVDFLVNSFKASDSFVQPAVLETGENNSGTATTEVTRQEYNMQLNKLLGEGKDYHSPEVKALQAKRTRSMQRGIN